MLPLRGNSTVSTCAGWWVQIGENQIREKIKVKKMNYGWNINYTRQCEGVIKLIWNINHSDTTRIQHCRKVIKILQFSILHQFWTRFHVQSQIHFISNTVLTTFSFMCLRGAALGERRWATLWLEGRERLTKRSFPLVQGVLWDSLCLEGVILVPCRSWRMAASNRMTGQVRSPVCDCPTQRKYTTENWIFDAQLCAIEDFISLTD